LTSQGKLSSREGLSYEGGLYEESACYEVSFLTSTMLLAWLMNRDKLDFVLISWFPVSPADRVSVTPANGGNRFRLRNVLFCSEYLGYGGCRISVELRQSEGALSVRMPCNRMG
jgi:hypothetical protein